MSRFPHIAYLCEQGKRDELILEVSGMASMMGKTAEEVADGFLEAHKQAEENPDNPAFKEIAKIQRKASKFYQNEYLLDQERKK